MEHSAASLGHAMPVVISFHRPYCCGAVTCARQLHVAHIYVGLIGVCMVHRARRVASRGRSRQWTDVVPTSVHATLQAH